MEACLVDFNKRLGKKPGAKPLDPIKLYDTLDRASDKGPLRPAQLAILQRWHDQYRGQSDVIIKLHTGQGKTLIGLLLLQSRLHETGTPALYLCANNFLARQTCEQATQFGVPYCETEKDLPGEFLDGRTILITTVHKLFSGLTKFRLGAHSVPVGSLLLDDSHACVDVIRAATTIRLQRDKDKAPYAAVLDLFATELAKQGAGTFAEIRDAAHNVLLPVPYWCWIDRQTEVVALLAKHQDSDAIKFAWPLLRDGLGGCHCLVSGQSIEIAPYLPPLHQFGSFANAKARVFMSATVTNDSFLIRGLGLDPDVIKHPLIYKDARWSGEKMVLIPSLIDDSLDRSTIVANFGARSSKRRSGVVVLAPSFSRTKDWEAAGAKVATKDSIDTDIEALKSGAHDQTLVVANRYDGIDLPDQTCRLLILDSRPHSESLIDSYSDGCRPDSDTTSIRTARIIEQGLGRSVRGEKDYSVILLTGAELIRTIRARASRKYLSDQTRTQVEIGLEIATMAQEEIEKGRDPLDALTGLIGQCLRRDEGWKRFYAEQMNAMEVREPGHAVLDLFAKELKAEELHESGRSREAVKLYQAMADETADHVEKGWYLQEAARCAYSYSKTDSNSLQIAAHRRNRLVMRPQSGMEFGRLEVVSQRRNARIIDWIRRFKDYDDLRVTLEDILSRLEFGTQWERFELAMHEIGLAIGFAAERPEREWKEGPDNLWGVKEGLYFVIECKSEVSLERATISKEEAGQLSNAWGWFCRQYPGAKGLPVIIIPTEKMARAASLPDGTRVLRRSELGRLVTSTRRFFQEFKDLAFDDLDEKKVQALINTHNLDAESLAELGKKPRIG